MRSANNAKNVFILKSTSEGCFKIVLLVMINHNHIIYCC